MLQVHVMTQPILCASELQDYFSTFALGQAWGPGLTRGVYSHAARRPCTEGDKAGMCGRYEHAQKLFPGKPARGDFGEEVVQLSACFSQQVSAGKLVHDRQPYRSPVNAEAQRCHLCARRPNLTQQVPRTTRATPRWGPRRQQIDCG